jgi:hypothetical protein
MLKITGWLSDKIRRKFGVVNWSSICLSWNSLTTGVDERFCHCYYLCIIAFCVEGRSRECWCNASDVERNEVRSLQTPFPRFPSLTLGTEHPCESVSAAEQSEEEYKFAQHRWVALATCEPHWSSDFTSR